MKKFLSWAGGIATAVITAVLIYHFTTPTPPPPPVIFEGMVIDGEQNAPLKEAMVVFEIKDAASKGDSLHDFTDDHGSYRMDFSGLNKATRVSIHAQAKGFREPAAIALSSLLDDNRHDFVMMPLARPSPTPVAIPHGTPAATPVATPVPLATPPRLLHPPEYIRKMASPAIRIEFKR